MTELRRFWSGDEWQQYVNVLLRYRYGPGGYCALPDGHGDYGIDGFSYDSGHAYQAYAVEEPVEYRVRYERQRNKITVDIKKFIDNKADLFEIFGSTKITTWTLAVPFWDNPDLIKHANSKTKDVIDAKLPYVASNFNIRLAQESDFAQEAAKIKANDSTVVKMDVTPGTGIDVGAWMQTNSELINTLNHKVRDIGQGQSDAELQARALVIAQFYIDGSNIVDNLKTNYPEIHEEALRIKSREERHLQFIGAPSGAPVEAFEATVVKMRSEFNSLLASLEGTVSDALAYEAVADWLLRCPLRFR